jgi:hypothetical protein
VATVLVGSVGIVSGAGGERWMLIPIAVDAIVLIVVAFGCVAAFPLAVATDLRGRDCWLVAFALAGRHLVASTGILALAILFALSLRIAGPFFALAGAGPYCLFLTATVGRIMLGSSVHAAAQTRGR